jgi:hypothetical protein
MAGEIAVALHDRMQDLGWLRRAAAGDTLYELSNEGIEGLNCLGVDVESMRGMRRRLAFACLDWSERRPHIGGALGAALLKLALGRRWVTREAHGRALRLTELGRREITLARAAPRLRAK